jgi:hypothetical protein
LNTEFAEIRKNRIAYLKTLTNQDRVTFPMQGFSGDPKDYEIRIENRKLGAGMSITGDRPLASENLWSIRSVLAVEPFIHRHSPSRLSYPYYQSGCDPHPS